MIAFLYGALLIVSTSVIAIIANEFASEKLKITENKVKKTLLIVPITIVIWALKKIPVVGSWISIVIFFLGVGILVLYQFDKRK